MMQDTSPTPSATGLAAKPPAPAPAPTPKSILVANIAATATERNVADFFSYCGKIEKLSFRKAVGPENTSEAVITFQTDAAVTTALMLTNAQVEGRPIVVAAYVAGPEPLINLDPYPVVVQTGDQLPDRHFPVPDEQRSKSSVIASIIAGGYALGSDILDKAKEYDDKHNISGQLKLGAEELKKKVTAIDQSYGISMTAAALAAATQEKLKQVDQQYAITQTLAEKSRQIDANYQISASLTSAGAWISTSTQDLMNRTMANPSVAAAAASINQTITGIETESRQLIAEQQRQKQAQAGGEPSAQVDGTAAASAAASAAAPAPAPAPVPATPKQA